MADAAPAVHDALKSLRSKCESAPRFGVNGRYLILQAARRVAAAEQGEQKQQDQATNGSTAVVVHEQQQAEAAAAQLPAALTAPRAAALVPNQLKPFVPFKARAFTPQQQRQQVVNQLLGRYLVLLMEELQVPPQQQEQVIVESPEIMTAAGAASLAQEAALYREVTSAQAYNQRGRQLQAAVSFIPGDKLQQLKNNYKQAAAAPAAASPPPDTDASSMRKRQVVAGRDAQLQQQHKRQKADKSIGSKADEIQKQQQQQQQQAAHMIQLLDDLFEEHDEGEEPTARSAPAAVPAGAAKQSSAVKPRKQLDGVDDKVQRKRRRHKSGSRAGMEHRTESASASAVAAAAEGLATRLDPGQVHQQQQENPDQEGEQLVQQQQQQPRVPQLEEVGAADGDDDGDLDLERERHELLARKAARQLAAQQAIAATAAAVAATAAAAVTAGGADVDGEGAAAAVPHCYSPTASPSRAQHLLYSPTRVIEQPYDDETLDETAAEAAAAGGSQEGVGCHVSEVEVATGADPAAAMCGHVAAVGTGEQSLRVKHSASPPAACEDVSSSASGSGSGSATPGSHSQGDSGTSSDEQDDGTEQVDSLVEELFGAESVNSEQLEPIRESLEQQQQQQQDIGSASSGDGGVSQEEAGCAVSGDHPLCVEPQQACTGVDGTAAGHHAGVECSAVGTGQQRLAEHDDALLSAEVDLAKAPTRDILADVEGAIDQPSSAQETQQVTHVADDDVAAALNGKRARQCHGVESPHQQQQQQEEEAGPQAVAAVDAIHAGGFQDFEEFTRALINGTTQDAVSASAEMIASAAADEVLLGSIPCKVATFVLSVLEPLVTAGVVSKALSELVCDKAVGKIMKRHKDATEAGFLVKEYSAITRLVTDLVDHFQKHGLV